MYLVRDIQPKNTFREMQPQHHEEVSNQPGEVIEISSSSSSYPSGEVDEQPSRARSEKSSSNMNGSEADFKEDYVDEVSNAMQCGTDRY